MTDEELGMLKQLMKKAATEGLLYLMVDGDSYPVEAKEVEYDLDHIKVIFN